MSADVQPDIADQIEAFVRDESRVSDDDGQFGRDVVLFEEGYLDSLGVVRLIEWIELTFAVELSDEALLSEDFSTIEGIATIVTTAVAEAR